MKATICGKGRPITVQVGVLAGDIKPWLTTSSGEDTCGPVHLLGALLGPNRSREKSPDTDNLKLNLCSDCGAPICNDSASLDLWQTQLPWWQSLHRTHEQRWDLCTTVWRHNCNVNCDIAVVSAKKDKQPCIEYLILSINARAHRSGFQVY